MNLPIKIGLVDDQNLFREGMKVILSTFSELEIVLEANSGPDLCRQLPEIQPDLLLLDYTMPEMDGFVTMQQVQKAYPDIKVIILTMHYDESLMAFMMGKGANGYLLKDEQSTTVRDAILEVMKKGQYFSQYVSQALLKQLQQKQVTAATRKPPFEQEEFSRREKEILAIIGKYNRQELADQLFISIKTVDFHLKNLRDKTETSSTSELVRFAIKNGFQ